MASPPPPPRFWTRALEEIGLVTLWHSSRDVKFLCAQRFVRLFAYGGSTLILASYLSALHIPDDRIGLFMTLTLVGDVVISFLLTLFADAMGRKAVLALGSVLMAGSGVVFGLSGNFWVLLAAAVLGVISPSGNEIGPFRAVEESTLAHLVSDKVLSDIFAWYSLGGTAGTALGMMVCGWVINFLQAVRGWEYIPACRFIFFVYAAVGAIKLFLNLGLSQDVEAVPDQKQQQQQQQQQPDASQAQDSAAAAGEAQPLLTDRSNNPEPLPQLQQTSSLWSIDRELAFTVISLSILFGLDSFASGLASLSWMTYFFKRKFDLPEGSLGSIFFVTNIICSASTLVASSIAKRIGNVKTMVFTHLPSTIALSLIPIPSALPLALAFLILRSCSQSMDVAPRSAFLAAALPKAQRTAIMGLINVVKTCTQSLGPLLTGILAEHQVFGHSFIIAGVLKAVYDIGILVCFAGRDPPRRARLGDSEGR